MVMCTVLSVVPFIFLSFFLSFFSFSFWLTISYVLGLHIQFFSTNISASFLKFVIFGCCTVKEGLWHAGILCVP